jgi:hypothetical protein
VPIKGEIICDAQAYLQYAGGNRSYALGELDYGYVEEPSIEADEIFSRNLTEAQAVAALEEDLADMLILPPRFLGYATREKLWGQFFVDTTKEPPGRNPKAFRADLQLAKKYKDLIEALVESHEQREDTSGRGSTRIVDVVHEKGKGLVLLLHGPPGVGKTLTAETIAQVSTSFAFSWPISVGVVPQSCEPYNCLRNPASEENTADSRRSRPRKCSQCSFL